MRVCVPVTPAGQIDRWGRARQVAVAQVLSGEIVDWQLSDVGWDELHDAGTEGGHHARVARFVREQGAEAVVATHMGADMAHMLHRLGVTVHLGAGGDARTAVLAAARGELEAAQA
jgi:predicted Fe-Mo cluster-binding NifX family protein